MRYGIQVNVGPPGAPQWMWLHSLSMDRESWLSRGEAQAQLNIWYPGRSATLPNAKSRLFRVEEIDENP